MATRNLTKGSIFKGIVLFSLPLLGTSVIQQLYSTVDLLFVSNVLGTAATAALGVGALLITLIVGLFTGISVGFNVRVAHLVGADDSHRLTLALRTSVTLAFLSGVILVVVGELLAAPFVTIMDVPPESAALSLVYLRYAVAAILPIGVYNIVAGALRGMGDSASPLVAQAVGGLLNIAANWFALCVLGLGIEGCAAATLVANAVAAIIVTVILFRHKTLREGNSAKLVLDSGTIRQVFALGIPVALQTVAIVISNIAVQHQVDLFGVDAIAAFACYLKVELPIYFVILAIGQAATTFVAQNHGADDDARCEQGVKTCQILCLVLTVALSALMLFIAPWAFWLFGGDDNVIAIGVAFAQISFPFYFVYAVLEVQADTMRGYGHSLGPALIVLANICILRVLIVVLATSHGFGMDAIAWSYPITWTTTTICLVILRLRYMRAGRA